MDGPLNPVYILTSAFGLGAFSGLAALLRSGQKVNRIAVVTVMLNSGLASLAIAFFGIKKFQDNVYFLLGMCLLTGLGGATMVDFLLQSARTTGLSIGGVTVKFGGDKDKVDDDDDEKPR